MRALAISIGIALAVLITIALAPVSSWVFKNQLDVVTRSDRNDHGAAGGGTIEQFTPKWIADPNTFSGSDSAEQLTHALLLSYPERDSELMKYAASHPSDPLGWAIVVRMTCMAGTRDPDYPRTPDKELDTRIDKGLVEGFNSTERGEAVEPNNAYFPLMRAAFAKEQNRPEEVVKALRDAASKSKFDPHVTDEALVMNRALEAARGYRGELLSYGMAASVLLPDLSHCKSLARFLNRHGSMAEKRDLIQTDYLVAKGEQTSVGMLVGSSELRFAIRNPVALKAKYSRQLTDTEWTDLASNFDDKLKAAHVAPPVPGTLTIFQTFNRLQAASKKYIGSIPALFPTTVETDSNADATEIRIGLQTAVPYFALLALIGSGLFAAAGWGFSFIQSETVRRMAPHFVFIPAWLITIWSMHDCGDCSSISIAGLMMGIAQISLAFMRIGDRGAKVMTSCLAALALGLGLLPTLVVSPWYLAALVPCVLAASASWLLSQNQRDKTAAYTGAILALTSMALFKIDSSASLGGLAYFIVTALLLKTKTGETPRVVTVISVIIFLIVCGVIGVFTGWTTLGGSSQMTYPVAIVSGLLLATIFLGKDARTIRLASCICLCTYSALYMVAVGWQIRGNHEMSLSKINLIYEADNIRSLAGIRS